MDETGKEDTSDEVHVAGHDALVVTRIVIVAGLGWDTGAVAAVMHEEDVSRLGVGDEASEGAADVSSGWHGVGVICVDEDGDVVLGEPEALHQAAAHTLDVVDAAAQLGLGARVVAPDQDRLLPHAEDEDGLRSRSRSDPDLGVEGNVCESSGMAHDVFV